MTNELKQVYDTAQTVITLTGTLANAANSVAADCTQFVNTLNYPRAKAILNIVDTFAAAPTAGSTVDLYMTEDDIDGTTDETPVPAASDILYLARQVGSWVMDNQDVATVKTIVISLDGVVKARFFILNSTGQTISYSVGTTVKIVPYTYSPT